jgi:hypothetical protein
MASRASYFLFVDLSSKADRGRSVGESVCGMCTPIGEAEALAIKESLYVGQRWGVFEPNDKML